MYYRTDRHITNRERVTDADGRIFGRYDLLPHGYTLWGNDVTPLPIAIADQGNSRGSVRIIFDSFDDPGYVELVPLEVDDPVKTLMAASLMPRRNSTLVVTT